MAYTPRLVAAPPSLWRIGRGTDPYSTKPPEPLDVLDAKAGNRFDSADGNFAVRYFATQPEACFGEVLASLRPSLPMQAIVEDEWRERGFMMVGSIPADWRHRRLLVDATIKGTYLDIEADETHVWLEHQGNLAVSLTNFGVTQIDVPAIRGHDRRVTRTIAQWVHDHTDYADIRYLSRLDTDWE